MLGKDSCPVEVSRQAVALKSLIRLGQPEQRPAVYTVTSPSWAPQKTFFVEVGTSPAICCLFLLDN